MRQLTRNMRLLVSALLEKVRITNSHYTRWILSRGRKNPQQVVTPQLSRRGVDHSPLHNFSPNQFDWNPRSWQEWACGLLQTTVALTFNVIPLAAVRPHRPVLM
jgi:hypothetical protein